ncbi:MAG: NeuD/PglB/VioB family sugar acetyltransferase [Clostridiales bacterium]|jgi:sugar O-acyltransferase (sialic acid O-acetyltransferase NeuD family)|nr:NeuD/PglB/VioB family sugar acetyltransferase [Clostridiales bacterium]
MKDLIIIGLNDLSKEILFFIERINIVTPTWNILGYIDSQTESGNSIDGIPVFGGYESARDFADAFFVCAKENPALKKGVISLLKDYIGRKINYATIICPSAAISSKAKIGEGSVIGEHCVVGPNVLIQNHCLVGSLSSIGTGSVIQDFVRVGSGAIVSNRVKLGECCDVGIGAKILDCSSVGRNSRVGIGAAIAKDVQDNCVVLRESSNVAKFAAPSSGNRDRLVIFGSGGHAKVVADMARSYYEEVIFDTDNSFFLNEGMIGSYDAFVGIGDGKIRAKLIHRLESMGILCPTFIHQGAEVSEGAEIGGGTVIMAGAAVNTSAKIGKGSIVNTGATIDHDCLIGDFCNVAPGAHLAGGVEIGNYTIVGVGASIINNVTIADNVIIGSGATVIKSIATPGTYVGVPAVRI